MKKKNLSKNTMWNGVAEKFIQNNKKMLMDNNAGEKASTFWIQMT